jgi:DNA-binding CsgD family transcriptional regulator
MRFSEAERCYAEGSAFCDEHDMSTFLTCLQGRRAVALEVTGRWDEGSALARRLLDAGGASPINRLTPLLSLGRILARRGDASSWGWLDEAIARALGTGEPIWIAHARLARAEACWLEDRVEAASAEIGAALEHAQHCDEWTRGAVATWARRAGLSLAVPADRIAQPYRRALDGDAAAAAALWRQLGCEYDGALALLDSGAEPALREALRRFEALGADAAVQATRREMRRVGVRSIPSGAQVATRSHPAGLTRRECEVLELICAGHTNSEIARRLVVSTKTVDHHVSAVLAKLGVPSRRVAAAKAARLGLVGSSKN